MKSQSFFLNFCRTIHVGHWPACVLAFQGNLRHQPWDFCCCLHRGHHRLWRQEIRPKCCSLCWQTERGRPELPDYDNAWCIFVCTVRFLYCQLLIIRYPICTTVSVPWFCKSVKDSTCICRRNWPKLTRWRMLPSPAWLRLLRTKRKSSGE